MNYVPSINEWAVQNSLTIVIVSGVLTAGLIVLMELVIRKIALREEG